MVSYRLVISIIVGILFSFFTAFFFNMSYIIEQLQLFGNTNILRIITILIGANFEFDIISFFTSTPTVYELFSAQILATIFIGYLSGTISKGIKRGFIASLLIIIIDLLIWILLSVISGEDLMALFQGVQLVSTVGGILSAIMGAIIGGSIGGLISGPYEEVY